MLVAEFGFRPPTCMVIPPKDTIVLMNVSDDVSSGPAPQTATSG